MSFKGLVAGVSGLKSQSQKMEVIGNNLANLTTTGFKKSQVTFRELFSDVVKSASGGSGNIGGTNPWDIGSGVGIGSISNAFTQGAQQATSRALDFMVEGDDFFVVKNGANEALMLTRSGSFELDGNMNLVDNLGNKVQGFNVDRITGSTGSTAGNIQVQTGALPPKATTQIGIQANIDSSVVETSATVDTSAWELFSGGENFGNMNIAVSGNSGARETYGSGFYEESINYTDASAAINAGLNVVTLNAAPANLIEGFAVGDTISIVQGTNQVQRSITAINAGLREITLSSAAPGTFAAGALAISNITDGSAARGSSGAAAVHQDILNSQITMVDDNGCLVASFYRVANDPQSYTRATANVSGGGTITAGIGEFTNLNELKELIENTLRDNQLTNYAASTDLSVTMDKFGKVSFGGTGLVQSFRLVMNADNTEMLDRFAGIAMTDAAAVATTQARVDASGEIIAAPALGLGNRAIHASKWWFNTSGLENYGYNNNNPSTEYGEFAGLKLESGASGTGYGTIQLSLTNGLGNTINRQYNLVARDPDSNNNEFSTMGELAQLVQNTLRSDDFSSIAIDGTLTADQTATATFTNGRLSVNTTDGSFRALTIQSLNTTVDSVNNINRTDEMNFGTVLGQLESGVNGKSGVSNAFIEADVTSQALSFDSQGNEHTVVSHFVRDRSSGLNNIEWKYKVGLNPNLNTFASENTTDKSVYGNTYNSIEDTASSRGVLAFDISTGAVLSDSDIRYDGSANITFTASTESQEADTSNITLDFTKMTSYNGQNTVVSQNLDGFTIGNLVRLTTESNTGNINGVYSNGKIRTLARIGLMSIANPEGLQKMGSSYFLQTANSSSAGNAKGLDQIFAVGSDSNATTDSVQSKVHGNSLEASNVDLTQELTDMIVTQRSYSASGKIITSADDMLQEALNLKR